MGNGLCKSIFGPRREKTCLRWFANNKGADQPAHPRSLISAFVIHLLESIISTLATNKLSFFYLVSVAEQGGLSLAFSETPKTGFLATRPILFLTTLVKNKIAIMIYIRLSIVIQKYASGILVSCKLMASIDNLDYISGYIIQWTLLLPC